MCNKLPPFHSKVLKCSGMINAPINVKPHYPPPRNNRGQHGGIDVETQALYRGI